ncbi:MAG: hypothetical protein JJU40_00390 [Rhodobacteraceae bacterium]|nr:hypothetical protein [Paracoccaceae bacterium]
MGRVILHVGLHKTATTTLQDTFFLNRSLLARHGLYYPRIGRARGHHALAADWVALPPPLRLRHGTAPTRARLARLAARPGVTLFLSSEEFSRAGPASVDFAALRAHFPPEVELRALCLLRGQVALLQSIWLEVARNRRPLPLAPFLRTALEEGRADGLFLDFTELDAHLRRGLPPGAITYASLEEARAHPGGVIGWHLAHLGLSHLAPRLRPWADGRSNPSPEPLAAWVAGALSAPAPPGPGLVAAMAALLPHGEARSCLFSRGEVAALRRRFAPANAALARQLAGRQALPALPLEGPAPGALHREDLTAPFWIRLARSLRGTAAA